MVISQERDLKRQWCVCVRERERERLTKRVKRVTGRDKGGCVREGEGETV